MAFILVTVLTLEVFPTVYRGGVLGICNFFCRIGGILAPLTVGFSGPYLVYIFGALGIVSMFLAFFLPETKN